MLAERSLYPRQSALKELSYTDFVLLDLFFLPLLLKHKTGRTHTHTHSISSVGLLLWLVAQYELYCTPTSRVSHRMRLSSPSYRCNVCYVHMIFDQLHLLSSLIKWMPFMCTRDTLLDTISQPYRNRKMHIWSKIPHHTVHETRDAFLYSFCACITNIPRVVYPFKFF